MKYIYGTTHELPELTARAIAELTPVADRFDSIAVTGTSGLMVGAPVAIALGKPLVIVRKQCEDSHSWGHPGIESVGERYLFLDDFVAQGDTRARVADAVTKAHPDAVMSGTYLYGNDPDETWPKQGERLTLNV